MLIIISVAIQGALSIILVWLVWFVNTDMADRGTIALVLKFLAVIQGIAFILGLIFVFGDLVWLLKNNILQLW